MLIANCLAERIFVGVFLTLLIIPSYSNPFDPIMILTEQHTGSVVSVKRGQVLKIVLHTNSTTGYRWEAVSFSKDILQQRAINFFTQSKLYGAGAVVVFQFKALLPGETHLRIGYFRPFDTNKKYARLFQVVIKVS